jgi:ATP-dependent helicase/DNAse subunit B
MAITLITGPANAGKAQLVLDAVRTHGARGEEPLLIVPTAADVDRYRRELAEGRLVLGARVEQFEGLIEEMARRGSSTLATVGSLTREQILEQLHRRQRPAGQSTGASRGLTRALEKFVGELQSEHVSPSRLKAALRAWASTQTGSGEEGQLTVWLGQLFEDYQRVLVGMDRADKELRATWAMDELRRSPSSWKGTAVLFYGFDDLTALQFDAIETLGVVLDAPVTVSLAYEPGRLAFAGRAEAVSRLQPLARVHTVLEPRADYYAPGSRAALHHLERSLFEDAPARLEAGEAVHLLQAGGERAELELIAGEITALLAGDCRPSQIAVVHRSPASVASLLSEVFSSFAIPFTLERETIFTDTAIGAGLIGLLRCTRPDGTARDLLAWLRVPGHVQRTELVDRLESTLRRAGARSAVAARAVWEREHWKLDAIDELEQAQARGSLALIARLERELQRLFNAPRHRQARILASGEEDEARALRAGRDALAELRELIRAAPDLAPTAADITMSLERLELRSAATHVDEAVAVLGPLQLRARRVSVLFACGLQEGVFPAPARSEPLLAAEQRRQLAEASGLLIGAHKDLLANERYLLYACVSRPERRLVLSWHTSSDDGSPRSPSLFIDDICDLFDESLRARASRRSLGALHWPGPDAPQAAWLARDLVASAEPVPARAIQPLADEGLLEELRDSAVWSASGLESWASCPVRWFVERLLRAQDIEPEPEPLTRGGLAHAVLKDTLLALKRETGSARLTPARLQLAIELLDTALQENAGSFQLSDQPARAAGALRRLRADLERYLAHAAALESPLEPLHLELPFGFPEEGELPSLELGEGVRLRGRIDRIDVGTAGRAVLYDYKGKSAPSASKWLTESNFQLALYMHAAEQLLDLEAVGGFYQPLSGRDLRARGILMNDERCELQGMRTDLFEPEDFREILEQTLAAARIAAAQAAQGALQPRPQSCAWEGGCSYPSICRCGR